MRNRAHKGRRYRQLQGQRHSYQQRGFTLVEMVVTILIASIMAIGIVTYIGNAVEGFASASSRNKLATSGRTVVDRIAMELHNATPNTIRVTTAQAGGEQCIEFIPAAAATFALTPPTTGQGSDTFEVIAFSSQNAMAASTNGNICAAPQARSLYALLYPNNVSEVYDFDPDENGPVAMICEIGPVVAEGQDRRQTITLNRQHLYPRRSPVDRLFVSEGPVSFCVVNDRVYRYSGYKAVDGGFFSSQCTPATPDCLPGSSAAGRHLVTDRIDNTGLSAFTVVSPTLRRNAIISLNLNFTDSGDSVHLSHEILMRNVP